MCSNFPRSHSLRYLPWDTIIYSDLDGSLCSCLRSSVVAPTDDTPCPMRNKEVDGEYFDHIQSTIQGLLSLVASYVTL